MSDLILEGATVITMDPARRCIDDGAVVVSGDRIVDVGTREEVAARHPSTVRRIGGPGSVVLPGLIDAHGHAGHSLLKTLGADSPSTWMPLVTPYYFNRTTPEYWYLDGAVSALDRLRNGVTTGVSVIGSRPRSDAPDYSLAHARGYAEVGISDIVCVGPSGLPLPHPASTWRDGAWHEHSVTLEEMLAVTEHIIDEIDGTRSNLTKVYVTPFTIVPSVDPSSPSTPDRAVRLTVEDRAHARGVRDLAARRGVRIHSDAFGGMIRMAVQDPEAMILGPDVHLQHCVGLSEEEIALLAATGTHVTHAPGGRVNIPSMLAHGINVAITTDGSAPIRPFDLLQAARGVRLAHQQHALDPYLFPPGKLLEMITVDAARALGLEAEIGSLEVGKRADVVVLDIDQPHLTPWWMPVHRVMLQAVGRDVSDVVVAGELLLDNRVVTTVDEGAVLTEASVMARSTLTGAGLEAHLTAPGWGQTQRTFT